MADNYPRRHPDLEPSHPGDVPRGDVLPALGLPVSTAAKQIGVTRQTLHRILAGSAGVTPENGTADRQVLQQRTQSVAQDAVRP